MQQGTTAKTRGTKAGGTHPGVTASPGGRGSTTSGVTTGRNSVTGSHVTQSTGSRSVASARRHKCKNRGLKIELSGMTLVLCILTLKIF